MEKLLNSTEAATEIIGIIVIIGITVASISIMMVYSAPYIGRLQDAAEIEKVEQSFKIMDSRISKASLGEAPFQITGISLGRGSIQLKGSVSDYENSSIMIKLINSTGNITYVNSSFGTIEYELEDRVVSYEGGGVWSRFKYPEGSIMISPPEFHYNGVTLTLPIVKINGNSSAGGKGTINLKVKSENNPISLFPNRTDPRKVNPVIGDEVHVIIKSENYQAWRDYADSLNPYTKTSIDPANKRVDIRLIVYLQMGMQPLIMPIKVRGMSTNPNPINNFTFYLSNVGSNLEMDFRSPTATSDEFYISFQRKAGGGGAGVDTVSITIEYKVNDSLTEKWQTSVAEPIIQPDKHADVDMLNKSVPMEYKTSGTGSNSVTWGSNQTIYDPGDFETKGNTSLYNVTQHYMTLMVAKYGNFNIYDGAQNGDHWSGFNKGNSESELIYEQAPGGITYLHVTENNLEAVVE